MKILSLLAICLIVFASCEKENEPEIIPEQIVYEFQSVEYFLGEGDGIKIDSFVMEAGAFSNNSISPMTVTFDCHTQYENSKFSTDDFVPFKLINPDSLKISVPVQLEGNKIIQGSIKWNYKRNNYVELPYEKVQSFNALIEPYTLLNFKIYAILRNISTHYTAKYKEQKTGKVLEVNGIWKGQQIKGYNSIRKIESLK